MSTLSQLYLAKLSKALSYATAWPYRLSRIIRDSAFLLAALSSRSDLPESVDLGTCFIHSALFGSQVCTRTAANQSVSFSPASDHSHERANDKHPRRNPAESYWPPSLRSRVLRGSFVSFA